MGSILTKWWWGVDPDQPDPISGLTYRDIYEIRKTWTPIYADAANYGLELFRRFFRAEPATRTYFNHIKDMDEAQFSANPQFRAHAINLMSSLNMVILSLDEPEVVIAMMHKLGESHQKHHVPKEYFFVLKDVFVNFLVNDLKLTEAVIASWARFVGFIYPPIFATLNGNEP